MAVLGVCLVAGLALRVAATVAMWPASTATGDTMAYSYFASADYLENPLQPAGYSLVLALGGLFTRAVGVYTVLQHLLGLMSALVLFTAVRRLCGSPWPGVVGAAAILLGADQIYLENAIMSEALFVSLLAAAMYAAARAVDAPRHRWTWPVVLGGLAAGAAVTRSAGLLLIPTVALFLALAGQSPRRANRRRVVAFLVTTAGLLLVYASANAITHDRFNVTAGAGLRLYGRVAPFADCERFQPPPGTARLCERSDPAVRPGPNAYMFASGSRASGLTGFPPAASTYGDAGKMHALGQRMRAADEKLGAFGREAVRHQTWTYLSSVWPDVKNYFVPGERAQEPGWGVGFDQLDWSLAGRQEEHAVVKPAMTLFFDPFTERRIPSVLDFLYAYQRVFRFDATALTIAALLSLIGLLVGPRRNRLAVLLLSGSGLAMIVVPTFSVVYVARYTVPVVGLIAAGAAVGAVSIYGALRGRAAIQPPRPG